MPIGMISYRARSAADARLSLGYQSSGVAILRPSASVTTSSLVVNSTARGRKSPTSISKVLIPGGQQLIAIQLQVADNIANLVRRKPGIDSEGNVMQPEFGFFRARADMDVRG